MGPYPMGSDRMVNGKGWWKVFPLTTNNALPALYITVFKIPDDGNCNVRRNAGKYSTFETVSSRKPKLHIMPELRKRKDKIYLPCRKTDQSRTGTESAGPQHCSGTGVKL